MSATFPLPPSKKWTHHPHLFLGCKLSLKNVSKILPHLEQGGILIVAESLQRNWTNQPRLRGLKRHRCTSSPLVSLTSSMLGPCSHALPCYAAERKGQGPPRYQNDCSKATVDGLGQSAVVGDQGACARVRLVRIRGVRRSRTLPRSLCNRAIANPRAPSTTLVTRLTLSGFGVPGSAPAGVEFGVQMWMRTGPLKEP